MTSHDAYAEKKQGEAVMPGQFKTNRLRAVLGAIALGLSPVVAFAQLAPNAPADVDLPMDATGFAAAERSIASLIEQARASYPAARDRYLAGLPAGETFFVTTRLKDEAGRQEQVFIRVREIAGDRIEGLISNDIRLVRGFRRGQGHSFNESELIDWVITKPDGSEEGNVVGKFLESSNARPASASGQNQAPQMSLQLKAEAMVAERRGRLLFAAVPTAKEATRAQKNQARQQGAELCSLDYKYVPVVDGEESLTYLIATTRQRTDIIAGRHFLLNSDGAQRSTNTCLNMGTPRTGPNGERPVATTMTHLLSDAPNEYHVYLSLLQPVALIVLTGAGTWLVANGNIELHELRQDSP